MKRFPLFLAASSIALLPAIALLFMAQTYIGDIPAGSIVGNSTGSTTVARPIVPATARGPAVLNIDQMHQTGDANVAIASTTRLEATTTAFTAARTWTLPAANSVNPGQALVITDLAGAINGANTLIVSRAGADTLNGGTTFTLSITRAATTFYSDGVSKWATNSGIAGVTSVGLAMPGIFTVSGSPIVSTGTLTATAAGTSGGIPYFNNATSLASSAALVANGFVIGGGAGTTPATITACTADQIAFGTAGAPTCRSVSGDLTFSSGVATIAASAVTNSKLANMAANTVKANPTGGSAAAQDVVAQTARSNSVLNVENFRGIGDTAASIAATDRTVGTTATFTASRTWSLPAANSVNPGQWYWIADFFGGISGVNTLVIQRTGSDTVNGGTNFTLNSANAGVVLVADGVSKWTAQAIGGAAVAGVASIDGKTGAFTTSNGLDSTGGNVIELTAARRTLPTQQRFTSGTNATYTKPGNALWIKIKLVGGGGGGGGGDSGAGNGNAGGATCWNTAGTACTTPVFQAGGGSGGNATGNGGSGGTVSGSSTCTIEADTGNPGGPSTTVVGLINSGGPGGASSLGGQGANAFSTTGQSAATNSGSGGQGGAAIANGSLGGAGGGAGATCVTTILNPAATYVFTIGATGTGGAGPNGFAGGVGAAGYIVVEEFYGS